MFGTRSPVPPHLSHPFFFSHSTMARLHITEIVAPVASRAFCRAARSTSAKYTTVFFFSVLIALSLPRPTVLTLLIPSIR